MKDFKYLFLTAFALGSLALSAQNITTASIQWNSSSTFEAQGGNTLNEATTITTSNGHIVWKADDGTVKFDFTILETNGSWTNVNANGSIIFEVDNNGNRGTVQFQEDGSGTLVRITLVNDSPDASGQTYELTITNFELL